MPPAFPVSTQWVTFPTTIEKTVRIQWTENGLQPHEATYYEVKCFWGDLVRDPDGLEPPSRLLGADGEIKAVGSTKLYIAQEYAEKGYANGPMKKYHIADLARFVNAANESKVAPWITMQLNANFHYGQNSTKSDIRRWLVYHPSIIEGVPPPFIFQHRFTGLPKTEFLNAATEDVQSVVPDSMTGGKVGGFLLSKTFGMGAKLAASKWGDPLHRFLDRKAIEMANSSISSIRLRPEHANISQREKQLIAIQIFELQKIIADLNEAKKELIEDDNQKKFEKDLRTWIVKNKKVVQGSYNIVSPNVVPAEQLGQQPAGQPVVVEDPDVAMLVMDVAPNANAINLGEMVQGVSGNLVGMPASQLLLLHQPENENPLINNVLNPQRQRVANRRRRNVLVERLNQPVAAQQLGHQAPNQAVEAGNRRHDQDLHVEDLDHYEHNRAQNSALARSNEFHRSNALGSRNDGLVGRNVNRNPQIL